MPPADFSCRRATTGRIWVKIGCYHAVRRHLVICDRSISGVCAKQLLCPHLWKKGGALSATPVRPSVVRACVGNLFSCNSLWKNHLNEKLFYMQLQLHQIQVVLIWSGSTKFHLGYSVLSCVRACKVCFHAITFERIIWMKKLFYMQLQLHNNGQVRIWSGSIKFHLSYGPFLDSIFLEMVVSVL